MPRIQRGLFSMPPVLADRRIQPRRTGLKASDVLADCVFAFAAEPGYSTD